MCALPVELVAAKFMPDEEHESVELDSKGIDVNIYCMGSIAGHNVVIGCLPAGQIGNNPAAIVATQMQAIFGEIRFGLMVGIGGGVPSKDSDIRLGDVVVSQPLHKCNGVVQYDKGKATPSGFMRTGSLNSPPQILLSAVSNVQSDKFLGKQTFLDHIAKLETAPTFRRSIGNIDMLFEADYEHEGGPTCARCDLNRQYSRTERQIGEEAVVHYGIIASGDQVVKTARDRDRLSEELGGVLCFEMEAAGLINNFPCIVIRGICDYADSHKNKRWQPYAAGTAAAYAKTLLSAVRIADSQ